MDTNRLQISPEVLNELTPAEKVRIGTLIQWDLRDVHARVRRRMNWSDALTDEAVLEYRKFLALIVLDPNKKYCMVETVDEVWHQHLLNTRDYLLMCGAIIGGVIHHEQQPFGEVSPPGSADVREWTIRDLSSKFIGPLSRLWSGDVESLGKCCSSCGHSA